MTAVLWYLHDHGRGHLDRARAVLAELTVPVVVAAGPGIADAAADCLDAPVITLPVDHDGAGPTRSGPWHHAPAGRTLRRRTAAIADIAERHDCTTAVIDLSAEMTALSTLLGLRTVTVRQSGRRNDPTHRLGWACADVVWVPQHRELEIIDEPVDDHWFFSGPFSRFDRTDRSLPAARSSTVVLLVGRGGTDFDDTAWRHATAPAGWRVVIAGTSTRWATPNVCSVGFVDDLLPLLDSAEIVVTSAGWSSVADIVAARARPVLIPERRPFDEQRSRAEALAAAGLALHLSRWPRPDELGELVSSAMRLDPRAWDRWHDGRGATRAATMIEAVHSR